VFESLSSFRPRDFFLFIFFFGPPSSRPILVSGCARGPFWIFLCFFNPSTKTLSRLLERTQVVFPIEFVRFLGPPRVPVISRATLQLGRLRLGERVSTAVLPLCASFARTPPFLFFFFRRQGAAVHATDTTPSSTGAPLPVYRPGDDPPGALLRFFFFDSEQRLTSLHDRSPSICSFPRASLPRSPVRETLSFQYQ